MRRGMRARGLTAEDNLTPEEASQAEQMHRDMGRAMIRQWKLNPYHSRQFRGRIISQQLGRSRWMRIGVISSNGRPPVPSRDL